MSKAAIEIDDEAQTVTVLIDRGEDLEDLPIRRTRAEMIATIMAARSRYLSRELMLLDTSALKLMFTTSRGGK